MANVAGDIAKEAGLVVISITAAEDITKGDVVTLVDGNIADVGAGEVGPFGVALEAIANTETGIVAIEGEVYIQSGAAGFTAFALLMPSEVAGEEGQVVDVAAPVFNEVVGMALEAATAVAGGTPGRVRLGFR